MELRLDPVCIDREGRLTYSDGKYKNKKCWDNFKYQAYPESWKKKEDTIVLKIDCDILLEERFVDIKI